MAKLGRHPAFFLKLKVVLLCVVLLFDYLRNPLVIQQLLRDVHSTLPHREYSLMLLRLQCWSAACQGIQAWQSVCWQQRSALSSEHLKVANKPASEAHREGGRRLDR